MSHSLFIHFFQFDFGCTVHDYQLVLHDMYRAEIKKSLFYARMKVGPRTTKIWDVFGRFRMSITFSNLGLNAASTLSTEVHRQQQWNDLWAEYSWNLCMQEGPGPMVEKSYSCCMEFQLQILEDSSIFAGRSRAQSWGACIPTRARSGTSPGSSSWTRSSISRRHTSLPAL